MQICYRTRQVCALSVVLSINIEFSMRMQREILSIFFWVVWLNWFYESSALLEFIPLYLSGKISFNDAVVMLNFKIDWI